MVSGQAVNITINVQDADGGAAVEQVVAQLESIGPAGENAGRQAAAGLDQIGEHALTNLDNVRLLRDDFGIHLPRSMEKAIASSQMLSGAINAVGSGFLALGAVEIFARMGEGAYNLYEKYIDLNAAAKAYNEEMGKRTDSAFLDPHSIETVTMRLNDAAIAAQRYHAASQQASNPQIDIGKTGLNALEAGVLGPLGLLAGSGTDKLNSFLNARQDEDQSSKQQLLSDSLREKQLSSQHEMALLQIQQQHASDGMLQGSAQYTAELSKQVALNAENARYVEQLDNLYSTTPSTMNRIMNNVMLPGAAQRAQNSAVPNSRQSIEDQIAKQEDAAKEVDLERQTITQIIQMRNEATNAALQGNALRAAQEQQQIDEVVRKFTLGEISKQAKIEETSAIQLKFFNQAIKQQEELDRQTQHMQDDAAQAGLKGQPLIAAQLTTQLHAVDEREQAAVGPDGQETRAQMFEFDMQRDIAREQSNQKGIEEQQEYADRIKAIMQESDDFELQGYARIDSERRRRLDEALKADQEEFGKGAAAFAAFASHEVQIDSDTQRQRERLHQQTMEQVTKEEQQAARLLLPEWQQSQAAIIDQYNDRLHQIQQDVKQHVMTEQEGAAAVAAAWKTENAQMVRDAEQTRDKLASSLSDFFNNPTKYIEKRAMDATFQMMANDMMAYFKNDKAGSGMLQWLFGMGPEMSTSTNMNTDVRSIFGMGKSATGLTSAATLSTAGTQLTSAATTQITAAQALLTGATTLQSAASSLALSAPVGSSGFGGMNALMPGLSDSSSTTNTGSSLPIGSPDANGFDTGMSGGGFAGDYSTTVGDGSLMSSLQANNVGDVAAGTSMSPYFGAAGGALTAGFGIYNAYENSNPVGGAVIGAIGGAEIGAIGGPVGMAIGAIVGGIAGLFAGIFGDQGKGKAESLDKNTIQPEITKDLADYQAGRSGYNQVLSDLSDLQGTAKTQTSSWGSGARHWFSNHIEPEITAALATLAKMESGGRSAVTFSGAQFHSGGWVGDFGDFSTGPNEGFAKLLTDEFVVHPMAARSHSSLVQAINAGNVSYANTVQPRMPASANGGSVSVTIQALDSKSVAQWAKAGGGRDLMAALNQAQRQYSGVGRG